MHTRSTTIATAVLTAIATAVLTALATAALAAPAVATATGTSITVRVVDPSGASLPGVGVHSEQATSTANTTDANGRIVFTDVPGPTATMCTALRQDQMLGGTAGWYADCAIVVRGGSVTLMFKPAAAVSGTVTDARTGDPIAAAPVTLYDDGDFAGTNTDAQGHYLYRNLRPQLLTVLGVDAASVATSAAAPWGYADTTDSHVNNPVQLTSGGVRTDLSFRVSPDVRWTGVVVDGSGAAVPRAQVAVGDRGTYTTTTAGVNGTFAVLRPWAGGGTQCVWSRATAAHPTGLAAKCAYVATPGTSAYRKVSLPLEGGALTGRIVGPDGTTPPGVLSVSVALDGSVAFAVPGVVASNGTYRFEGLPNGIVRVQATSQPRGATAFSPVVSPNPGQVKNMGNLVLSAGPDA